LRVCPQLLSSGASSASTRLSVASRSTSIRQSCAAATRTARWVTSRSGCWSACPTRPTSRSTRSRLGT
jgi:hypothetical protein